MSYYNFKLVMRVYSISRYFNNHNVILKYLWFLLVTESQILLIPLWVFLFVCCVYLFVCFCLCPLLKKILDFNGKLV